MTEATVPTYTAKDGQHIFNWQDGSELTYLMPERDEYGRLWVEAVAKEGDNILSRSRLDVLNSQGQELFARAIASVNGTVDWRPRLVFATEHVLEALKQHSPTEEGDFLQRPTCRDEAFHGPLGKLAKDVGPYTEADPVSILVQSLIVAGADIGRGPWFQVGATPHHANEFTVIVGPTGMGRKGTGYDISWAAIKPPSLLDSSGNPEQGDGRTFPERVKGIGSGEGLIYAVRDPIFKTEPVRGPSPGKGQKGPIIDYEQVMVDPGVDDKRLIVEETEFARVLKVASREGNTLSELLRQLWETGDLRNTVKGNPCRASGVHGVVIAHITAAELHKLLATVDMSNGFTNRFLWIWSQQTRDLPDGDELSKVDFAPARRALKIARDKLEAIKEASQGAEPAQRMRRTEMARAAWHAVYPLLNHPDPATPGAIQGRAAAHVLRLSMIYALVDGTCEIDVPHLFAALALWEHVEASARYIFGAEDEDPTAKKLLDALTRAGDKGLTRESIRHDVFQGHEKRKAIDAIVRQLCERGCAEVVSERTSGRSRQVVRVCDSAESVKSAKRSYVDTAKEALSKLCSKNGDDAKVREKVRDKCVISSGPVDDAPFHALNTH